MKMLLMNRKILIIFSFTLFFTVVLPIATALSTDFEIGTQFGISHYSTTSQTFTDSTHTQSSTFTQIPSMLPSPFIAPGLYTTWFPNRNFAVGPEFSLLYMSDDEMNFNLGGRAAYFLSDYAVSNPYVLGRISTSILRDQGEEEVVTSFGIGLGYQWRIGAAIVLRTEGQYQRVFNEDKNINVFSFVIGLGTRFGSSKSQNP